jgi:hypothetical protein
MSQSLSTIGSPRERTPAAPEDRDDLAIRPPVSRLGLDSVQEETAEGTEEREEAEVTQKTEKIHKTT